MAEKKASFLSSSNPRDYLDETYRRIPRMRAATTSDKVRDWMLSLQDNPAMQAIGFMSPTNRRAQSNLLLEKVGEKAIKGIKKTGMMDSIEGAVYDYVKNYPGLFGHLKTLKVAPKLKSQVQIKGEENVFQGAGYMSKHPRWTWTPSVEKLNRKRAAQKPRYEMGIVKTPSTGTPGEDRLAREIVRHETAHLGQIVSNKDKLATNSDIGYWLDPREIRARAVAAKEQFDNPISYPYAVRLKDSISQGISESTPEQAQAFWRDWELGNLNFPTKQVSPTKAISFRDWMNQEHPSFDAYMRAFILSK